MAAATLHPRPHCTVRAGLPLATASNVSCCAGRRLRLDQRGAMACCRTHLYTLDVAFVLTIDAVS
jgi:hypothetical protein